MTNKKFKPNNNFHEDMDFEKEVSSNHELWTRVYSNFFPDFKLHGRVCDKGRQMQGIDRVVKLAGGRNVYVDEKVRRKDYGDMLIEEYSMCGEAGKGKKKGWIKKDLNTDYIAYYIQPSDEVRMYSYQELKSVYESYKRELNSLAHDDSEDRVVRKKSKNSGGAYYTQSICVDYDLLDRLIYKNRQVDLNA